MTNEAEHDQEQESEEPELAQRMMGTSLRQDEWMEANEYGRYEAEDQCNSQRKRPAANKEQTAQQPKPGGDGGSGGQIRAHHVLDAPALELAQRAADQPMDHDEPPGLAAAPAGTETGLPAAAAAAAAAAAKSAPTAKNTINTEQPNSTIGGKTKREEQNSKREGIGASYHQCYRSTAPPPLGFRAADGNRYTIEEGAAEYRAREWRSRWHWSPPHNADDTEVAPPPSGGRGENAPARAHARPPGPAAHHLAAPAPMQPTSWQRRLRRALEWMGRHAMRLIPDLHSPQHTGDNKSAHAASDDPNLT
jgi:hypothetical protein